VRCVYCIAFDGDDFIMVFNPKRNGWEMPGGKVEEGESDLEAARREFREEVGHEMIEISNKEESPEVTVFAARLGPRVDGGEMTWRRFQELPERLSFPKVEYLTLIAWARGEKQASDRCGDRKATVKD